MVLKKYFFLLMVVTMVIPAFAGNQAALTATKVQVFKPTVIPTITKSGVCWVNSSTVARADVWRCMVANNIFDPCFSLEAKGIVVCGIDPSKNDSGFSLKLTQPLPQVPQVKTLHQHAWMLKLEDDQICRPYTGTRPMIPSGDKVVVVQYACQDSDNGNVNGILEGTVIPGKLWQAKKITYRAAGVETKIIKIQTVKIKEVWR